MKNYRRWMSVIAAVCLVGCGMTSPLGPSYSVQDSPDKAIVTLKTSAGEIPINLPKAQAGAGYHGTATEQGSQTVNGQTVTYQIKYEQHGDQLTLTSLMLNGQELVQSPASNPVAATPSDPPSAQPTRSPIPAAQPTSSPPPAAAASPPPSAAGEILAELSEAKSTLQFSKRHFSVKYRFPNGRPRVGGALYWVVESASGERAHSPIRGFELRDEGTLSGQIVFNRYDAPFKTYLEFGTHNPSGQRPRITEIVAFEEPPPPPSGPIGAGGSGPTGGPIGPRRPGR